MSEKLKSILFYSGFQALFYVFLVFAISAHTTQQLSAGTFITAAIFQAAMTLTILSIAYLWPRVMNVFGVKGE